MRYRSLLTVGSVPAVPLSARRPREYPALSKTDPAGSVMVDFCRSVLPLSNPINTSMQLWSRCSALAHEPSW